MPLRPGGRLGAEQSIFVLANRVQRSQQNDGHCSGACVSMTELCLLLLQMSIKADQFFESSERKMCERTERGSE